MMNNEQKPGLFSQWRLNDHTTLLNSLGLVLLGVGSLIVGAQLFNLNSLFTFVTGIEGGINSDSFPVILFLVLLIAGLGVVAGGLGGMAAYALGNGLLGALFFFGDIHGLIGTLGFVLAMVGFALRLFNQP